MEETDEYENIQRRFKRANQVSEVLNADNEEVGKTLVESKFSTKIFFDQDDIIFFGFRLKIFR